MSQEREKPHTFSAKIPIASGFGWVHFRGVQTQTKLTKHRASVLARVTAVGATRESPLRLHGADFKAAVWLYEHDLLGKIGSSFYPL